MNFKVMDLFSGAGGFSFGVEKVPGFEVLIGVDFDKSAIETFRLNHKNALGIIGDVTDANVKKEIISVAKDKNINMIIGGPPCQGFSLKGKKLGLNDPRNYLFLEFLDFVKKIRPQVFVIENVKSMITTASGFFIDEIVRLFSESGYIVNHGILNAVDFNVPQNRKRAIVIGSLDKSIDLPSKLTDKPVTVRAAISDLAYLKSGEGFFESDYLHAYDSDYQRKMRSEKLYNHVTTKHSDFALKKLSMIPPEGDKSHLPLEYHGKQKFSTTWSRLIWDQPSPTIDTRFDTPSNGRNSHPILNRTITPREAARLQSFPDSFIFLGTKTAICRQIGNAVPPFMAKEIAKSIKNSYKKRRLINSDFSIYNEDSNVFIEELLKSNILVDHIITDPPYNISTENNFKTMRNPRSGINFGKWDHNFDLLNWIEDYSKLLKKDGSIIIFCSYKYLSFIVEKLESLSINVKDVLIWRKSNPMPRNLNRRYVQDMEFAIWGVKKNAKWVFNKPEEIPYLRSMFEAPVVSGYEKTGHPTQKSLVIMENLIKIHTNENQLIIDPFMGSGTTGVASIKLKRKFIGIEKDPRYYLMAEKRILEYK